MIGPVLKHVSLATVVKPNNFLGHIFAFNKHSKTEYDSQGTKFTFSGLSFYGQVSTRGEIKNILFEGEKLLLYWQIMKMRLGFWPIFQDSSAKKKMSST